MVHRQRADARKLPLERQRLDLDRILEDLVEPLLEDAAERGLGHRQLPIARLEAGRADLHVPLADEDRPLRPLPHSVDRGDVHAGEAPLAGDELVATDGHLHTALVGGHRHRAVLGERDRPGLLFGVGIAAERIWHLQILLLGDPGNVVLSDDLSAQLLFENVVDGRLVDLCRDEVSSGGRRRARERGQLAGE